MISGSAFDVHFPTAATLRAAALVCHVSVASPSLASPQRSLSLSSHISLSLRNHQGTIFSSHISLSLSDLIRVRSLSHHISLCLSLSSQISLSLSEIISVRSLSHHISLSVLISVRFVGRGKLEGCGAMNTHSRFQFNSMSALTPFPRALRDNL